MNRNTFLRGFATACLASVMLMGAGCAAQSSPRSISYKLDPSTDFSQFKTFSVGAVQEGPHFPEIEPKVNAAVTRKLTALGYSQGDDSTSDLVIRYAISVSRDERVVSEQIPVGNGAIYNRVRLEQVNEGGALLNVIDRATGKVIWKATSVRDIGAMTPSDFTDTVADEAIGEIFESFPAK